MVYFYRYPAPHNLLVVNSESRLHKNIINYAWIDAVVLSPPHLPYFAKELATRAVYHRTVNF